MTGAPDPRRWTAPGAATDSSDDLDLSRVTTRAEARALAEAVARSTASAEPAANRPVAPAPVPSPHVPAVWGAAAPTPPRPFTPTAPPPPPAAPPPPLKARRSGLSLFGTVLRALVVVTAVGEAGYGLLALWASNAVVVQGRPSADLLAAIDPFRWVDVGPARQLLLSTTYSLVTGTTQLCLIIWLAMVAADRRTDRRFTKRGPAGVVLGFLVPIINVWWPYQALRDAWRGTDLRPAGKPTPMTIVAWWTCTIGAGLVGGVLSGMNAPRLLTGDLVDAESSLLLAVGVTTLILVVAHVCLSFAIGRVCFHLDAHDLLREHHERTHPPLYRAA